MPLNGLVHSIFKSAKPLFGGTPNAHCFGHFKFFTFKRDQVSDLEKLGGYFESIYVSEAFDEMRLESKD